MDWDRLSAAWPLIRDVLIVVTALGLIVFEAVFHKGDARESLLFLYSGLLAAPIFLRADSRRSNDQPHSPEKPQEVEP